MGKLELQQSVPYQNRLRRDNLSRVIEALWRVPGLSRAELARSLRLDRSTTGQLADTLVGAGALDQLQDDSSGPRGGRPPVRLYLRSGLGYAIGLELTIPHIRLVAIDLSGTVLEYREVQVQHAGADSLETMLSAIRQVKQSVESMGAASRQLLAVGVGVSAVVDSDTATIVRSDALKLEAPVAMEPLVNRHLDAPVAVFNDAQASALGELYEDEDDDLLLALVEFRPGDQPDDIGVGVGLVVGGRLRHGRAITHMLRPERHLDSQVWGREHFIDEVARGLALIANAAAVRRIVLGGDIESLYEELSETVRRHAIGPEQRATDIRMARAKHGPRSVAIGACRAAIERLFRTHRFPISAVTKLSLEE